MPILLSRSSAWLTRTQRANTSDLMTYARAGCGVIALPIMRQKANSEVQDADGNLVGTSDQDFTFAAADLVIGGQQSLPMRRDRITVGNPSTGPVYEVLDLAGVGPFKFCDGFHNTVRVHTKFIGLAPQTY